MSYECFQPASGLKDTGRTFSSLVKSRPLSLGRDLNREYGVHPCKDIFLVLQPQPLRWAALRGWDRPGKCLFRIAAAHCGLQWKRVRRCLESALFPRQQAVARIEAASSHWRRAYTKPGVHTTPLFRCSQDQFTHNFPPCLWFWRSFNQSENRRTIRYAGLSITDNTQVLRPFWRRPLHHACSACSVSPAGR